MPLLWSQLSKTPRALNDPARRTHEVDEHIRMLIIDLAEVISTDSSDSRVFTTNKAEKIFECANVSGIQSSYNAIAFRKSGVATTLDTIYLRYGFSSCNSCRSAVTLGDFQNCRWSNVPFVFGHVLITESCIVLFFYFFFSYCIFLFFPNSSLLFFY